MSTELVDRLPWADRPVWRGVDCGEGWHPIIERLDAQLRELCPTYRVMQVKEKFGGLRYYVADIPHEVWDRVGDRVRQAEREAAVTCEWCGEPGEYRAGSWVRTLCDACQVKAERREFPWTKS